MPADDLDVAVLAPTGRDAELAERVLGDAGMKARLLPDVEALCEAIRGGCGAAVIAGEALAPRDIDRVEAALKSQPAWSDLPVIVLTARLWMDAGVPKRLERLGNVTLIDRPVAVTTLVYTLRAATRCRARQYEVRKFLAERDALEQRMREGQRLESLGVLAGGLAHDFNNLLTPILGNAQLMIQDPWNPENEKRLIEIVEATQHATRLTAQMLAYAGKGRVNPELIDVSQLVSSIVRLLRGSATAVHVELDLPAQLPLVKVDVAQLQQVVMNLVMNGAESMDDQRGGTLTVRTSRRTLGSDEAGSMKLPCAPGSYVSITVSDTGCGMDEQHLARIFEPFYTSKFAGRGLGLAAVWGIVRRHDGGLRVESSPGRGTTFEVLLPEAAPPRTVTPSRAVVPAFPSDGAGRRVLVVDDDAAVRRLAQSVLERAGYRVHAVPDGLSALAYFEDHARELALVLLDATMPRLSAQDVIPVMKEVDPNVRIVMMSGFGASELESRHADPSVRAYVVKPFMPEALLEALRLAVRHEVNGDE